MGIKAFFFSFLNVNVFANLIIYMKYMKYMNNKWERRFWKVEGWIEFAFFFFQSKKKARNRVIDWAT